MLYLIATPIGNLADITLRALETLKRCDYILCEDTRHSQHLLEHYAIRKPLKSFHAFNEAAALDKVIEDLEKGLDIALISDAGTPLFADPGFGLVKRCEEKKLTVTAIPGANAALTALLLSGFAPMPFQAQGFLPKKEGELKTAIQHILLYKGTSICFETPHRIQDTLTLIQALAPQRALCIARELTKVHEECLRGTAQELLSHFSKTAPRGEIVLLFSPPVSAPAFEEFSTKELVFYLQKEFALSTADAIKLAAELHQVPKRAVYKQIHC